jgi:hypothetical protein
MTDEVGLPKALRRFRILNAAPEAVIQRRDDWRNAFRKRAGRRCHVRVWPCEFAAARRASRPGSRERLTAPWDSQIFCRPQIGRDVFARVAPNPGCNTLLRSACGARSALPLSGLRSRWNRHIGSVKSLARSGIAAGHAPCGERADEAPPGGKRSGGTSPLRRFEPSTPLNSSQMWVLGIRADRRRQDLTSVAKRAIQGCQATNNPLHHCYGCERVTRDSK